MQIQSNPISGGYRSTMQSRAATRQKSGSAFSALMAAGTQQKSGTANSARGQSFGGTEWTDEKLALLVGLKEGVTIDTSNTINWQSTGDQKLTEEQISALREKYDVTNLTRQDYYDLMSELTHMNVLSGKDIEGMHLKKVNLGPDGFMVAQGSAFSGGTFSKGNILDVLKNELAYISENAAWSTTKQFLEMNPAFGRGDALDKNAVFWADQAAYYGKLQDVFGSISR